VYITRATINGLEETATYPIVVGATKGIKTLLGVYDTVPLTIGDNGPLPLGKDKTGKVIHTPDILDEELHVEFSESSTSDYDIALTSLGGTIKHIYADPDVRSMVRPVLYRKTLTLNVTYYAKSKSKVASIANRLRSLSPSDSRHYLHDIEYFYYLPEVVIDLLDNINNLKNTYTTPPVDLDDYIANTFDTRANILNSETGNPGKLTLGIREKQEFVLGTIDTDVVSISKEKDSDTGRWYLNIEYSMEYELPTQLLVSYPITVYNQPIPKQYRLVKEPIPLATGNRTIDSGALTDVTTRDSELVKIPTNAYYLKLPQEDNLVLPQPEQGYVRLFSVVCAIDNTALSDLFYLDEIPYVTFNPDVLALIKLEASRMGDLFTSLFYIDLYNHDDKIHGHKVVVSVVSELINGIATERVKLTTNLPLDIKGCYRVSFNVLADLPVLHHGTLTALKNNIDTVDAASANTFSVIDTVLSVFNLDTTMLKRDFAITDKTTSLDIAMNISNNMSYRMFTKQTSLVLTEMLVPKN